MGELKRDRESIGLSNDFLFGKVMRNPELCKEMLELILDVEIERLEYPQTQKNIDEDKDGRGVRLNIYVKNGKGDIFNTEVQILDTRELPKRSRYYSSMIDLQELNKGETYWNLKQSYVIFICTFDLFGKGLHKYTFENVCLEDKDISLGDGTTKIFLNTEGTAEDVSEDLKAFLDYVGGRNSENGFVKKLNDEVNRAKQNERSRKLNSTSELEKWMEKAEELKIEDLNSYINGLKNDLEAVKNGIKHTYNNGLAEGSVNKIKLTKRIMYGRNSFE